MLTYRGCTARPNAEQAYFAAAAVSALRHGADRQPKCTRWRHDRDTRVVGLRQQRRVNLRAFVAQPGRAANIVHRGRRPHTGKPGPVDEARPIPDHPQLFEAQVALRRAQFSRWLSGRRVELPTQLVQALLQAALSPGQQRLEIPPQVALLAIAPRCQWL